MFDDADLDAAAAGAMAAKYRNMGQTCVCANRIYVQDGIYDSFAAKLAEAVAKLKVGDGLAEGVQQGPLITPRAVEKVEAHIADALAKGARVLVGGKRHELGGNFFQPTVLADVTSEMVVAREETFGPVAPLFRFKDEADVIAQANATQYGLAAYFYARDLGRVFRVAEALEYGMVAVNSGILSTEVAPFGGVKESGIGREGSRHGIEEFTEIKYVLLAGLGAWKDDQHARQMVLCGRTGVRSVRSPWQKSTSASLRRRTRRISSGRKAWRNGPRRGTFRNSPALFRWSPRCRAMPRPNEKRKMDFRRQTRGTGAAREA